MLCTTFNLFFFGCQRDSARTLFLPCRGVCVGFTIPSNALKQKQLFCSLIVDIFVNVRIIRLCVNQVYGFVAFDLVN